MKDIYKRIADLAEEVNTLEGKIGEDNMSIIIGVADCNTERATLCCSGVTEGILEMISRTVYQIYGEDSDETERVNGKIS